MSRGASTNVSTGNASVDEEVATHGANQRHDHEQRSQCPTPPKRDHAQNQQGRAEQQPHDVNRQGMGNVAGREQRRPDVLPA